MSATVSVYEGTVLHRRLEPTTRQFEQRLFLAYLDVDQLPASLDGVPGWSARGLAPVRFRRRDFLDGDAGPLGDAVRQLVHDRLGRRPHGPVRLLAQLRTFGWLFNPLSVYYCFQADGRGLDALVLEVTSTPWGERHWYVVDALGANCAPPVQKAMHVSPFLPMELGYAIEWSPPGEGLRLAITATRDGVTVFGAELRMHRRELDRRGALAILLRYPWLPLRVSLAIYRRAVALRLARVPMHRHPARSPEGVRA